MHASRMVSTTLLRTALRPLRNSTTQIPPNSLPLSLRYQSQIRGMPDAKAGSLKEFLVLVPDFPGKLHNRRQAQPAHIEDATPMINAGNLPYFGVTLSNHASTEGEQPDINGSLMVVKAENEASLREFLERDAYTKAGVWDVTKAQIYAFKGG